MWSGAARAGSQVCEVSIPLPCPSQAQLHLNQHCRVCAALLTSQQPLILVLGAAALSFRHYHDAKGYCDMGRRSDPASGHHSVLQPLHSPLPHPGAAPSQCSCETSAMVIMQRKPIPISRQDAHTLMCVQVGGAWLPAEQRLQADALCLQAAQIHCCSQVCCLFGSETQLQPAGCQQLSAAAQHPDACLLARVWRSVDASRVSRKLCVSSHSCSAQTVHRSEIWQAGI